MSKRISLNAFSMATPGHQSPGLWRHPQSKTENYTKLDYWTNLAKVLEKGRFDALFLADVLGPYDVFEGSAAPSLRDGMQIPANDPMMYVSAMAQATKNLGFAVTAAVTFENPYALARRLSTLDHVTAGRIGWNVVSSYLNSAALNHGMSAQMGHDERYAVAEEFMEVVYKLWEGSWEDDAVVIDREKGIYVDPEKVHPIEHAGEHFNVPGFHMCEPSPQRSPVIYQAGGSPRGRAFAAKHGEGIFVNVLNPTLSRQITSDIRATAEAEGRNGEDLKIFSLLTAVVADSDAAAERKLAEYRKHASHSGALALFGGWSGIDLSKFPMHEPLKNLESNGIQTVVNLFTKADPSREWTPAAIGEYLSIGGMEPVIAGSPETIADEIERWVDEGDLDGINLSYAVAPGDFEDFVELVVPELQKRGRVWKEYEGSALREYLRGEGNTHVSDTHPAASHSISSRFATK